MVFAYKPMPSFGGRIVRKLMLLVISCVLVSVDARPQNPLTSETRPRARDLGIRPGVYDPAPKNAITDVAGVLVGQVTITEGDDVRTGVTVILPHGGNMFQYKVDGAVFVYNAFGKLVGSTQVNELGQIETPIVLTNTLSVWEAASALTAWTLTQEGNEDVRSVNPLVDETNDGWLNDIRGFHVKADDVKRALQEANNGPVEEGSVGAGEGTMVFGWKGGIGTSSRHVPEAEGGYTVGVLVQTNFGGRLTIAGIPIWKKLQPTIQRAHKVNPTTDQSRQNQADGSCMIVVATDAPLDSRQLRRLAARAILGLARAGSTGSNGSGDFAIAFSTTNHISTARLCGPGVPLLTEDALSPLFEAVIDATEEAIDDSLLKAQTVIGRDRHIAQAIPISSLRALLAQSGIGK
jgi:D-aminopeptidase